MRAPQTSRPRQSSLTRLEPGATYRATTCSGTTVGEYLGLETPHGDRTILLRGVSGTAAIPVSELISIRPQAA